MIGCLTETNSCEVAKPLVLENFTKIIYINIMAGSKMYI